MHHYLSATFLFAAIFCSTIAYGQAPQLFNYQSVARDANGNPLMNVPIGVQLLLHDQTATGTVVYQETHAATTNTFGLFTLKIGNGTPTIGSLANVAWASGPKFIEVQVDVSGGTAYQSIGTSELLSVPYALYANESGDTTALNPGIQHGNTLYWDGTTLEWITDNQLLFNTGSRVGIGTNSPLQKLHVHGNINIAQDSSYMINNKKILWAKGTGNLFIGTNAGAANSIGFNNTFIGFNSGLNNQTGTQNAFIGTESGQSNFDGSMNSFFGRRAGFQNLNGNENTFIGAFAGQSNTDGLHNSFFGVTAGNSNTLGNENTFLGAHAGYFNTFGNNNTFVGNFAGQDNISGSNNTFVGFEADLANGAFTNVTVIGAGALATSSNSVVIGNSAVVNIGGQVSWGTLSDQRLKTNIVPEKLGLEFILALRPVNYTYVTKGQEGKQYTGLIAQEVHATLQRLGTSFSGIVLPQHDKDYYSIRYGDFVIPLINAVQEQEEKIKSLENKLLELEKRLNNQ